MSKPCPYLLCINICYKYIFIRMKSQYLFLKCCIECDSLWIPCKIKWGKPCRRGPNEYTLIMLWILPALYLGQSVSTLGKQLSYERGICFVNSIPRFPHPKQSSSHRMQMFSAANPLHDCRAWMRFEVAYSVVCGFWQATAAAVASETRRGAGKIPKLILWSEGKINAC